MDELDREFQEKSGGISRITSTCRKKLVTFPLRMKTLITPIVCSNPLAIGRIFIIVLYL